jgi:AraC-like DNA-binding protein
MKNIVFENTFGFSDIIPLFSGEEICKSSHSFGPYVREHHIIHFCLSGKGVLFDKFGVHEIKAGEFFVIRPGETTTYTADEREPWYYIWIAFSGTLASAFTTDKSVYSFDGEIKRELVSLISENEDSPEAYAPFLYRLLRLYFSGAKTKGDKLLKIKSYIDYNYMNALSVEQLSELFAFERSYLFRIFKARFGIGVKEYLTSVRMERAIGFLSDGHSVSECAALVGYGDEFNFSKAFKKKFGASPNQYKKKQR